MSRRSGPEQIEFTVGDASRVVDVLAELSAAGRGWVNLLPEVDSSDAARVQPSAVGAMFRAAGAPIPEVTVMAPTAGRRPQPMQLGLSHGAGTPVLRRLAASGLVRPEGWQMVQDHTRRGVVLRLPDDVDPAEVVAWAVEAATLVCPIETSGRWLAEVHRG